MYLLFTFVVFSFLSLVWLRHNEWWRAYLLLTAGPHVWTRVSRKTNICFLNTLYLFILSLFYWSIKILTSTGQNLPVPILFLSDEGPTLETVDYSIRIGSTPTFLYFDLYLHSACYKLLNAFFELARKRTRANRNYMLYVKLPKCNCYKYSFL